MDRLSFTAATISVNLTRGDQLTSQKILDPLHVYLHVADFDRVLDTNIRRDNGFEDLFDDTRDHALQGGILDICALQISLQQQDQRKRSPS